MIFALINYPNSVRLTTRRHTKARQWLPDFVITKALKTLAYFRHLFRMRPFVLVQCCPESTSMGSGKACYTCELNAEHDFNHRRGVKFG